MGGPETWKPFHFAPSLIGLVALFCFFSPISAFFPWDWQAFTAGSGGVSHETQTFFAFTNTAQEFFGIDPLTSSMEHARRTVIVYNAAVDKDQVHSAKHFDGESLPEGQTRLIELLTYIQKNLTANDAFSARKALGEAFHTIQDFYSHSNWVEISGGRDIYPGLGDPSVTLSRADPSVQTCTDCTSAGIFSPQCPDCSGNIYGDVLTTGYFPGDDRPYPGEAQKCQHGGLPQFISEPSIRSFQGINKDSLTCGFSPHFDLHRTAASLGIDASEAFLRLIRSKVTPRELKLLYGIGPSLGFAIDTTGSMGDVIAAVDAVTVEIVNRRLDTALNGPTDQPNLFVLAPFNDPVAGTSISTSDGEFFKAALASLSARGGDDCPELSMAGVLAAIAALDTGANLFVITDASASDGGMASEALKQAKAKDIRLFFFIFDSRCSFDQRYIDLADQSGGKYFSLAKSQAGAITTLVDKIARANIVSIMEFADVFAAFELGMKKRAEASYEVPIDSAMNMVTFALSSSSASLTITRPDGSLVTGTDVGVSLVDLKRGTLLSIDNPTSGNWKASVSGSGNASLSVTGTSSLHFSDFDFVQLSGRPGHQGYYPIDGFPAPGADVSAIAFLNGDFKSVKFELRDVAGRVVKELPFTAGSGEAGQPPKNSFFGNITLSTEQTLVYVSGEDSKGSPYLRVYPAPLLNVTKPVRSNGTGSSIGGSPSYPFLNGSSPSGGSTGTYSVCHPCPSIFTTPLATVGVSNSMSPSSLNSSGISCPICLPSDSKSQTFSGKVTRTGTSVVATFTGAADRRSAILPIFLTVGLMLLSVFAF